MPPTIVVCDDEDLIRWSLCTHLDQEGFHTVPAANGQEALAAVSAHGPSLLLMDLKMPIKDGLTALRELRAAGHETPVVVLTAHGAVDTAIEATRLGANAYLTKPFDLREVTHAVQTALEQDRLKQEVKWHRTRSRKGYGKFIGGDPSLGPLFDILQRLERVDAPTVLLLGESGTGKDVIARAIHARGLRKDQPFVEVDCAALPETLIESELFGHERGAFTDAKATKRGLFEIADHGIVFLDEIGELAPGTQSKLLRALEDRTFKRVGGVQRISMDVGIVAATNRDLKAEVQAGRFREDLFFRLNVIMIRLPSLRDRASDIPPLVDHFLDRFATSFGRPRPGIEGQAMELLSQYRWPGNVRELRNVLERLVLLGPSDRIRPGDLPPEVRWTRHASSEAATADGPFQLPEGGVDLEAVERGLIYQALQRTEGNQSAAARLLGITRYTLRYRMEKHGLT